MSELNNPSKPKPKRHRHRSHKKSDSSKKSETSMNSTNNITEEKRKPRDFRVSELLSVCQKFPITSINGKEFKPFAKKTITKFLTQTLTNENDIYAVIQLKPSDPDFPFDLQSLKFSLNVPINYPMKKNQNNIEKNKPSIVILNQEIPRGISINIENGFKKIVEKSCKNSSKKSNNDEEIDIQMKGPNNLLGCLQTLDFYMASFLSQKKKDTIKIIKRNPVVTKEEELVVEQVSKFSKVSRNDINSLNEQLEKISYKLNDQNQLKLTNKTKQFKLYQNVKDLGYIYTFYFDFTILQTSVNSIKNYCDDFKIKKLINLFEHYSLKNLNAKIMIPFDIKNKSIEVVSLQLPGFEIPDNSLIKDLNFLINDDLNLLLNFLNNFKINFNDYCEKNRSKPIFQLLNYLNCEIFKLGLNYKLI